MKNLFKAIGAWYLLLLSVPAMFILLNLYAWFLISLNT